MILLNQESELTNFIAELKSLGIEYLNICCGFMQSESLSYYFSVESCLITYQVQVESMAAIPIDSSLARILILSDLKYAATQFLGFGAYSQEVKSS